MKKNPLKDGIISENSAGVGDVTDGERDLAFANFQKAASHFDIQMKETDWHQFV